MTAGDVTAVRSLDWLRGAREGEGRGVGKEVGKGVGKGDTRYGYR